MSDCFRCGEPWSSHARTGGKNDKHHRVCADGKRAHAWRRAASNSFTVAEIEVLGALAKSALMSQAAPMHIIRSKAFASLTSKFSTMKKRIEEPATNMPCKRCGKQYRATVAERAAKPMCCEPKEVLCPTSQSA